MRQTYYHFVMNKLAETLVEQNLDRCMAKLEALGESQDILMDEMQRLQSIIDTINAATSPVDSAEARIKTLEKRFTASNQQLATLKSRIEVIQARLGSRQLVRSTSSAAV